MATPTEQLRRLLYQCGVWRNNEYYRNPVNFDNFKRKAMSLVKRGADAAALGGNWEGAYKNETLLHVLVSHNQKGDNNAEIAQLVQADASVLQTRGNYGTTAWQELIRNLLIRCENPVSAKKTAMCLAQLGADITEQGEIEKYTMVHVLLLTNKNRANDTEIAALVDLNPNVLNVRDCNGNTPLHFAVYSNDMDMVKLFVSKGANLGILNNKGQRASALATSLGHHDLVPWLIKPDELLQKIQALHDYGVLLKEQGASKGQVAIDLANTLTIMTKDFLKPNFNPLEFAAFEEQFIALLHSKDKEMSAYRIAWKTIIANIAIALTGIGLLLIAVQLIYSKVTENRALFFFQESKTTSEEKIAAIELQV